MKNKHSELCEIGAEWISNNIDYRFKRPYVLIEFHSGTERPDIYGLSGWHSLLIEVKTTHQDFKNDRKKKCRKSAGIGLTRYYLCSTDLIKVEELPEKWGLLYCDDHNKITVIKESECFDNRKWANELTIMQSVIRRLAGKQRILDFRKI